VTGEEQLIREARERAASAAKLRDTTKDAGAWKHYHSEAKFLDSLADALEARLGEQDQLREAQHRHGYSCEQAEREIDAQMASKLEAQECLRLICEVIALPLHKITPPGGQGGWREGLPTILARIKMIVDEAERAFRERDAALAGGGGAAT
jgi:hypothetical protein